MSTPRYDQAVNLAARHFLAEVPEKATADEIFDALSEDELPPGYMTCDAVRLPLEDLREWVGNLADDFMRFAGM